MKLMPPAEMATCGDICIMNRIVGARVAIGAEVTESVPSGLKGSSNSLAAGGALRTVDVGCSLGMLHWVTEAEVMGKPAAVTPWHP